MFFSCFSVAYFGLYSILSISECVSVVPPAARLAIEEMVDVKQVGMREKVPDQGEQRTAHWFVLAKSLTI